ncbi:MAG: glycosyltransferase [Candidatus Diapherotrites archaeon]|uniref:Glycosyltransferase n=1 Tax=Candidatus Iainarchaeum sp. TaxID=3101447 RepID=A0A938YUE0_9ARCH|nr:glycosyltransferase [Candidatus Diapherotrites archaeon]
MAKISASVVVPVHNGSKTIEACLKSILGQKTGYPYEVIVVDDGSTDSTAEIVNKFKSVKLVSQRQQGPAVARNNGAKNAKNSIVVFVDSDCIANSNWLQEMLKPLEKESIAGVQGRYKSLQKELVARLIQLEIEQRHDKMAERKFIDFMGSFSAAYRKRVFMEMKGFDTSFPMASGEDTDLSFRIAKKGYKLFFSPKAIVAHLHPTSFRKYLKVKFYRAFWRIKVYGKHREKVAKDSYTSQTVKVQIALVFLLALSLAAGIAIPLGFYAAALFAALLFLSGVPFAAWAFKRDKAVGTAAPFVIMARSIVFSAGLVLGTLNQLRSR